MIYDAHCHLDLMNNMAGFIKEMQNSDMSLFAVGITPKVYDREGQFCRNNPHIKVGLGMHPQLISSGYYDMSFFKTLLKTKSRLEIINTVPVERILLETDAPFTFKVQHV